jgi:hypothetical protein
MVTRFSVRSKWVLALGNLWAAQDLYTTANVLYIYIHEKLLRHPRETTVAQVWVFRFLLEEPGNLLNILFERRTSTRGKPKSPRHPVRQQTACAMQSACLRPGSAGS